MSEFRRFISYIYSYHKAEKLKNTGFAKIEARGEVCRVEIHIKGAYPGKLLQCNAYGFYRKDGFIKGVLLGKFVVKNGTGDVRIVTDRNKMGNTLRSLEDLGGIYITMNDEEDNAMASEWDNLPVDTAYFQVHSEEDERAEKVAEESVFPSEENLERDNQWEEGEDGGKVQTVEEVETVEKVQTVEEVQIVEKVETVEEVETIKEVEAVKEAEPEESVLNEQSILCGEMNVNVDNYPEKDEDCGEKTDWKTLLREYPVVNPFAYMDNIEVIRIQPKDINRLAKKYWVLGSNSFLLHGYCSYRYLILGRNIKEDTFFIGIPGIFHPREKMMASMFGFNEFRMSRNGRLRQGEFGYYIRPVELE